MRIALLTKQKEPLEMGIERNSNSNKKEAENYKENLKKSFRRSTHTSNSILLRENVTINENIRLGNGSFGIVYKGKFEQKDVSLKEIEIPEYEGKIDENLTSKKKKKK